MGCANTTGGDKKKAAAAPAVPSGLVPLDGMQKAVAKNMEKTLDVPIFRVSRTIVTDKFDELYKVPRRHTGRMTSSHPHFYYADGRRSTLYDPPVLYCLYVCIRSSRR